jgi:hypothetical protein
MTTAVPVITPAKSQAPVYSSTLKLGIGGQVLPSAAIVPGSLRGGVGIPAAVQL